MIARGRLAPSPTGHLHLGNAWAFLLAWLSARSAGGQVVLRMEDIDPQRSRPEYAAAIMDDLRWLGLDWDEGPDVGGPCGPYLQSARAQLYQRALERLESMGMLYPCFCTRRELRTLAGAPHVGDGGAPYPGTCSHLSAEERTALLRQGRRPALRVRCDAARERFTDMLLGPQTMSLHDCGGDFALRRSDGVIAYQLAVVVDDAAMRITQAVRGNDILASTPRQLYLARLLGLSQPRYGHIPLLLDRGGERLAKRHASLTLRALRDAGAAPQALVGLLAWLARLQPAPTPVQPRQLCDAFRWDALPHHNIRLPARLGDIALC